MSDVDQWTAAAAQSLQSQATPDPASIDAAVGSTLNGQAAAIRNNVSQALPLNADNEAVIRRYAAATNVPIDTARAMPDAIKQQAQMSTFDAAMLARKFPTTAQLLAHPELANITHDDIPTTAAVEQSVQALSAPPPLAQPAPAKSWSLGGVANYLASADGAHGLMYDAGSLVHSTLQGLGGAYNKTAGAVNTVLGALPVAYDYVTGKDTTAGDWWFRHMVDPAVQNESAFTLAPDASYADKVVHMGGSLAGTLSQIILTGGAGAEVAAPAATDSVATAVGAATAHGIKSMATPAVTEAVNTGRDVYQATGGDGYAALKAATAAYGTTSAMGIMPLSVAGGVLARTATGGVSGLLTGEASRRVMNAALPDSMQAPFNWEDAFMNAASGAALGGVLGPRAQEANAVRDATHASNAATSTQLLGDLASASAASKLRERDPAVFKQFVQDAAADGPVPAVYVDGRQFAESLHQSGIPDSELAAKMPAVADQMQEALGTGGMVRIPIEDFATHIAGSKLQDSLMPHLRTDPAGMSLAESDAFYQSHVDQLQAGAADATQPDVDPTIASRHQVIDSVRQQLADTGRFPDGVNDAYAALHGTFYATMAERAGMLPHELLEQHPVQIAAESPTADTLSADSQRGAYDPSTKTIAILKGADLTTFLHESGHHFLDTLSHVAAHPDAPAGIKADMGTLLKSFGVSDLDTWHGMSLDEQRAHHETFARGFEHYLMEGKAPDLEMRGLFGRFRAWLVHVYKSLSYLHVDVTPEVRGVFDRMLASAHAIKEAETARAYMPMFHTPEQASMSPQDWSAYQALGKNATDTAIESLTNKTVRDMAWSDKARSRALKALGKDADAKRQAILREVRPQVMAEPVYRAWAFLTGRDQTGHIKEGATQADADHAAAVRQWADARTAHEGVTRAKTRADAWESSDASKLPAKNPGLAKGQWLAKNRARIENDVQRAMLDYEEQAPRPRPPAKPVAPHSTDSTLGAGKLNTAATLKLVGKDITQALSDRRMTSATGIDPGLVADMFGFRDGEQLAKALTLADHPNDVANAITEQQMLERHGEIASPQALARTADEAVHNEVRTRFIATELRALKKAIGPARDLAQAAKEVAEGVIDAKRVRDINEGQYSIAETRAAKEADKRLTAGDTAGAAVAKRDQLLNNQLTRAARDALDYVSKSVDYLQKFDKASVREGIDLEYREQIDALLDRADIRKSVSGKALDKRQALSAFVEQMSAGGYEPQIPEGLLDEAQRWHYKDMPLMAFRGLVDAVKSIEHLGKLKSKLIDLKETREISDLADEVRATTATLDQRAPESNRGLNRMESAWLNVKTVGRSLQASLLKMEQMFDWLDARNPNGVLNRVVFRRISEAGVHENTMLARVKGEIDQLVHSHLADVTKDGGKIYEARELIDSMTGQPQRFTKKQMLMLAGNMGNESNAAKMALGEKWEQRDVWNFLNAHMGKADWDFVAGIGKALEGLWPEKLAMSRRLGATNPPKIQPRAFDTPHGRYDGWYWPMIYDPARAQDVAERGARAGDALFENIYSRANSDTGRMNTRNENYARPLLLDLDAIPRVIKDEIHDIAFREAVIDADRFLSHPVVHDSIVSALSQQHYDQLKPWLQSIANDGKSSTESMRALKFFADLASGVRTRATIVGLGYRVSTMLVHGMSAGAESIAELGPVWFGSGLKDFANPLQWSANKDFIFERSGEMRNRMNEVDRDVREHLRAIDTRMMDPTSGAIARGADSFKAKAYWGIAALDMATALPTWMGAYKKGMTPVERGGLGMGEADAVYFADKTVRNAHGGTGVKDLAAVQRGPELMKLFTMFYTFWNHNVNRLIDTARLAKDANTWRDSNLAATVIMRTLVYTIGVQVMHSLLHPPKDGADEESWAKWAGKQFLESAFAGIPFLRDVSAHEISGKDYSATPAAGMVRIVDDSRIDALNALTGQEVSDKWLKHTITTTGAVFALPTGQIGSTAQFLWDVGDGKADPQSTADWWNGVTHGDMKHH